MRKIGISKDWGGPAHGNKKNMKSKESRVEEEINWQYKRTVGLHISNMVKKGIKILIKFRMM